MTGGERAAPPATFCPAVYDAGCAFLRHGGRHDVYVNPLTGQKQPIARHSEIDEHLARHIKKHLGVK